MRCRASSTTISVCTHTSPSGCHSGSCGQPTSAFSSGTVWSIDAEIEREARSRSTAGRPAAAAFRSRPRSRSAGRSSSGICLHNAAVPPSSVELEPRGELHAAQHAQAVFRERPRIDGAQHAALKIGAAAVQGSMYSPVSGSNAIALIVKSRRREASSIGMSGSPVTVKPRVRGRFWIRGAAARRRRRRPCRR